MKKILNILVAVLSLSFMTVLLDGSKSPVEARQCVWNKSGAVLGVHWYRPVDLLMTSEGGLYPKPGRSYVQRDVFPVAQGKCQRTNEELVAVLICDRCDYAKKGLQFSAAVVAGIGAAVACGTTAGLGCAAGVAGASAVVSGVWTFLPDTKQLRYTEPNAFDIVTPPQDRWLDVWGTVFNMQDGPGGARWFDNNDRPTCDPCYDGIRSIRNVLQAGWFYSQNELDRATQDNRRNGLISNLTNRTRDTVSFYQSLNDGDLAGVGALLVYLRGTRRWNDQTIKTWSADDMRNTVIVEVAGQTGRPVPDLQALSNADLIQLVPGERFFRYRPD
jgi:hypothetical protein